MYRFTSLFIVKMLGGIFWLTCLSFPKFFLFVSMVKKSFSWSLTLSLSTQALPSGGIYVFASQLHTHLAGRGVRTILVRGGKELEVVQEDQHFSTHYQVGDSRALFTQRNSTFAHCV